MINSEVFFLATEDGLVCWNFKEHRQFALDRDYALRLIRLAYGDTSIDYENTIDREILNSNLLSLEQGEKTSWGWDPLSRIFHFGTRDPLSRRTLQCGRMGKIVSPTLQRSARYLFAY